MVFTLSESLKIWIWGGYIVSVFLVYFGVYFYFYVLSDRRAQQVQSVLPNALNMIAANVRSGLTPFQAVKLASIGEFGVLGEEFAKATSLSMGSASFSEHLLEITQRVNSPALQRTLRLFGASLSSGAHVADLLDTLALDINERASLKEELMTNMKTNLMFIMFIIIIGTPMLLAISIHFVDTVTAIQSRSYSFESNSDFGAIDDLGGQVKITSEFIEKVAYGLLFFTGLFAAIFIGAVIEGDPKAGLKYAPVIIISSYVLFFIMRYITSVVMTASS
jgi:flagellar protein FlaJ